MQKIQGRGEGILLVEDEKAVRELTSKVLSENGYCAIEADCAQKTLNIFEQEQGKIFLVLSDLVLPDSI